MHKEQQYGGGGAAVVALLVVVLVAVVLHPGGPSALAQIPGGPQPPTDESTQLAVNPTDDPQQRTFYITWGEIEASEPLAYFYVWGPEDTRREVAVSEATGWGYTPERQRAIELSFPAEEYPCGWYHAQIDSARGWANVADFQVCTDEEIAGEGGEREQTPTPDPNAYGYVPMLNGQVTGIKLFESGVEPPAREQRAYTNTFVRDETRYINWELLLEFPAPGAQREVAIHEVFLFPDGHAEEQIRTFYVEPHWTEAWLTHSWGREEPGLFPPGAYTLVLFVNDREIANATFEVTGAPDPTPTPTPNPEEGEAYIPSLDAIVDSLRLFAAGPNPPAPEQRQYADTFAKAETRYIHWELALKFPSPSQQVAFDVHEAFHFPDGSVKEQHGTFYLEPATTEAWFTHSWGWSEAGQFPPGPYTLVLSVGGQEVIRKDFAVTGQADPTPVPADTPPTSTQPAPSGERCFDETGYCVQGRLLQYWNANGALPVFGLPITAQQREEIEGQALETQWFERNRLELHPENTPPYDVLLGRLGVDVLEQQGRDWEAFPKSTPVAGCLFFEDTGHNVCGDILQAWRSNGLELDGVPGISDAESLALFGLPLSDAQPETIGDQELTVQWFERARFEVHPELDPPHNVLLGLLGRELHSEEP
jgi:hypothetical protein